MANDDEGKTEAEKALEKEQLEKAVSAALDKLGIEANTTPEAAGKAAAEMANKLPAQMLDLFTMVVEQAKAKQAAATPITPRAAEPESPGAPAEPSAFEQAVQASVKKAVEGYVQDHVVQESPTKTEITMDAEFLKAHGAGLLASVVQGFAQAIIPEKFEVELEQPTATTDQGAQSSEPAAPGEKKTVQMKVDFGNLIGGFLSGLAKNVKVESAKTEPPKPEPPGDN